MRHLVLTLAIAAFCALTLTACSNESAETPDDAPSQPPASTQASNSSADEAPAETGSSTDGPRDVLARGARAWKQGNCTMCHGADGRGNRFGPDLTNGQWNHCDGSIDGIRKVLVTGISKDQFVDPSHTLPMPPATELIPSEDDLDALAEYVKSLSNQTSSNE